ncbi:MAG TPA: hypothetical protein VF299_11755 [Mycobacterium sp.]
MVDVRAIAVSGQSLLAAGAVTVGVAASVLAPPVARGPTTISDRATLLTSAALPVDLNPVDWLTAPGLADTTTSIGQSIEDIFNTLEPWAQYGANLLSWLVGWVPFAGLLAPEINFFYTFNEAVIQSLVFNVADLVDGTVDFNQALSNISAATTAAFNTLVDTQISWIQGLLPPPPPFAPPPVPPGLAEVTPDLEHGAAVDLGGLPDPDLTPIADAGSLDLLP